LWVALPAAGAPRWPAAAGPRRSPAGLRACAEGPGAGRARGAAGGSRGRPHPLAGRCRGGRPEGGGRVLVSGGRGETKVSSSSRRRRRSCTSYKHTAPISPRMSVDFRMLAPGVLRSALGPLEASPAPPLARSACQEKGASVDP
ncbi:unnamed protein product, partial [Prorocentrum cordatum]